MGNSVIAGIYMHQFIASLEVYRLLQAESFVLLH